MHYRPQRRAFATGLHGGHITPNTFTESAWEVPNSCSLTTPALHPPLYSPSVERCKHAHLAICETPHPQPLHIPTGVSQVYHRLSQQRGNDNTYSTILWRPALPSFDTHNWATSWYHIHWDVRATSYVHTMDLIVLSSVAHVVHIPKTLFIFLRPCSYWIDSHNSALLQQYHPPPHSRHFSTAPTPACRQSRRPPGWRRLQGSRWWRRST